MSYVFVLNFEAIGDVTLILGLKKPPRKDGVNSDLSQKRLEYGKKYFTWLYVLKYPFIPTNPLLAAMSFFFHFSFFFLNLVCSFSPKPQNIEIYVLCKVIELQTLFFHPKLFGATTQKPPEMGSQKINFFNGLS